MPQHITPRETAAARANRFALIIRSALLAAVAFPATAFAQVLETDTPIVVASCSVFNALSGPAAFIVGLMVLVVGGIAIAIGGKRVIGGVVWGIIGVGLAISATNIAAAIFPGFSSLCG